MISFHTRLRATGCLAGVFAILSTSATLAQGEAADRVTCHDTAPQQSLAIGTGGGDSQPDLLVTGICKVDRTGDYYFGNVNIVDGGSLVFVEPAQQKQGDRRDTSFWAKSIIVEAGGALQAGVPFTESGQTVDQKPYGSNGNTLNIVLYGADQSGGDPANRPGTGVACQQDNCGAPYVDGEAIALPGFPAGEKDYFYRYHPVKYDDAAMDRPFSYKSLGVGYDGVLQLRGLKGIAGAAADADPMATGNSWRRLGAHLEPGATEIVLEGADPAGWAQGDRIVVTTTDYLPDHSEEFTIVAPPSGNRLQVARSCSLLPAGAAGHCTDAAAQYFHNGQAFPLSQRLKSASPAFAAANKGSPLLQEGETRAAVGLLTRSIRIVSGGDVAGERFDWDTAAEKQAAATAHGTDSPLAKSATDRDPHYQFGAHTVFRQGFRKLQIQGVEFRWMGQGGRIGHYPVHFHMARRVPPDTWIKDSAVNESMTRWMVLHATQDVTLQRNVGYKSIGHGFYLEDATETDNRLYANLGIFARAGVEGPANPRNIPGILAHVETPDQGGEHAARVKSDIIYPTVFWFTNGWNDFVGNMAAGANACGGCYWQMPATDNASMKDWKWSGYSALAQRMAGSVPLKQFYGNSCSTAMFAFNHIGSASDCKGVGWLDAAGNKVGNQNYIFPVKGYSPVPKTGGIPQKITDPYYPATDSYLIPTKCSPPAKFGDPDSCQTVNKCSYSDPKDCRPSVVDTMSTSFNWAETNFAAIWMRAGWNLVDRLFMSDIQNGGIGLITGGDYTRANLPVGFWSLLSHSVFVGKTQDGNPYASEKGPMQDGKTMCQEATRGEACIVKEASTVYPLSNWSTNRMINIYDGPFYQTANAYLDIEPSDCDSVESCMYHGTPGVRRRPGSGKGYLPNAAIGWKQPNGFYYPPAFHSSKLHFDNVGIRHYLTVPLFEKGSYITDPELAKKEFLLRPGEEKGAFRNFTDVDRQTVLNDIDGTLTGFKTTISVNQDPFFSAPLQVAECLSQPEVLPGNSACAPKKPAYTPTARTSPYEHVTTVVYPSCASPDGDGSQCGSETVTDAQPKGRLPRVAQRGGTWSRDCTGPFCTGVRLYRQYLTAGGGSNQREMEKWREAGCDKPENLASPACDWPFIRLAGISMWQRSALTANNGAFYIETTRSRKTQRETTDLGRPGEQTEVYVECDQQTDPNLACQQRSVNVFEGGQTYNVFFVFAKRNLKQRYQVYVGPGFSIESDLKAIRAPLESQNIKFKDIPGFDAKSMWNAQMLPGDVLQVEVDFSKLPDSISFAPKDNGLCKPAGFCGLDSAGSCGCALPDDSPLLKYSPGMKAACEESCRNWAMLDVDCPEGGCVGFSFKLPGGFVADDTSHRPMPGSFLGEKAAPAWREIAFGPAGKAEAGQCYYDAAQTPKLSGSCQAQD